MNYSIQGAGRRERRQGEGADGKGGKGEKEDFLF